VQRRRRLYRHRIENSYSRCLPWLGQAEHPDAHQKQAWGSVGRPRHTVRRELEALHMLRLLQCHEEDDVNDKGKVVRTIYEYSLADAFDRATLLAMTARKTPPQKED
jgi:hypothetical protein